MHIQVWPNASILRAQNLIPLYEFGGSHLAACGQTGDEFITADFAKVFGLGRKQPSSESNSQQGPLDDQPARAMSRIRCPYQGTAPAMVLTASSYSSAHKTGTWISATCQLVWPQKTCLPSGQTLRREEGRRSRCFRMIPASARNASLASAAPGNTDATSGSNTTTTLPSA
jgi:hypothetical protein